MSASNFQQIIHCFRYEWRPPADGIVKPEFTVLPLIHKLTLAYNSCIPRVIVIAVAVAVVIVVAIVV